MSISEQKCSCHPPSVLTSQDKNNEGEELFFKVNSVDNILKRHH